MSDHRRRSRPKGRKIMNQSDHTDAPLSADRPTGRPRNLWRLPLIATAATAGLTVLSIVLDAGNARARDLALLVGAPTFYLLLPATVACLVVALVRQIRGRRIGLHRQ
jgi:hypothetical protein